MASSFREILHSNRVESYHFLKKYYPVLLKTINEDGVEVYEISQDKEVGHVFIHVPWQPHDHHTLKSRILFVPLFLIERKPD